MQETTVTHQVFATELDLTWLLLAAGAILLTLAVVGLIVVLAVSRRSGRESPR
jgi:hypothetical protein